MTLAGLPTSVVVGLILQAKLELSFEDHATVFDAQAVSLVCRLTQEVVAGLSTCCRLLNLLDGIRIVHEHCVEECPDLTLLLLIGHFIDAGTMDLLEPKNQRSDAQGAIYDLDN